MGAIGTVGTDSRLSVVDDCGIGEADRHVESGRPVFLEIARLAGLEEGIMGKAAVQRVCLEPFFTPRNAVGARMRFYSVKTWRQVTNDYLAGKGG